MRFVAKENKTEGKFSKKNGSRFITLSQLVDMFYVSRFNRDNLHDLVEGEDIDNSRKYRIFNKADVKELMEVFCDFFEWVINAKNIGKIYITKDISLVRESTLPRLKYATGMDEVYLPNECKAGEYYITHGRYMWRLWIEGDTFQKMKELWMKDPEFLKTREELTPEMEERNKNAKSKNTN